MSFLVKFDLLNTQHFYLKSIVMHVPASIIITSLLLYRKFAAVTKAILSFPKVLEFYTILIGRESYNLIKLTYNS